MNYLLSINHHFLTLNQDSEKWIEAWKELDKNQVIDGAEFSVNLNNEEEREYVKQLAAAFKKEKWIFQLHGPEAEAINYKSHIDYFKELSSILGHTLLITFHPFSSFDTPERNIIETIVLLKELNQYEHLEFAIENLNGLDNPNRLDTESVDIILANNRDTYFCWDIGHEVDDGTCDYRLNTILAYTIKNVHFHDIGESDHHPFIHGKTDGNKALQYLKDIGYSQSIVFEIAWNYLNGETKEDKLKDYIRNLEQFTDFK